MKRFIVLLALMGVVFAMSPSSAQAAETGPVSATVTARLVSVLVTQNNVAYGVLDTGDTNAEPTGQNCANGTSAFTVENDGNAAQDFNIKGFGSANWSLVGTAAANGYVHRFSTVFNACVFTSNEIATSDTTLKTNVASNATQEVFLNLDMPTSTAFTDTQTLALTITAIATP